MSRKKFQAGQSGKTGRKYGHLSDPLLSLILLISLAIALFHFSATSVWWDSSVYIGMGKYMFSNGASGFWEDVRPPLLPVILGLAWKIGLDPLIAGKVLMLAAGLYSIYLAYTIAMNIFGRPTALLASAMLAFSPTFVLFQGLILTDILAVCLSLFGIYLFIRRHLYSSGVVLALAFIARFLHLAVFLAMLVLTVIMALAANKKGRPAGPWRGNGDVIAIVLGFLTILVPFLAFNFGMYGNIFQPFIRQIFMSKYTGWIYWKPAGFYVVGLLKENFLSIFFIAGILGIRRWAQRDAAVDRQHESEDKSKFYWHAWLITCLFILYFAYFTIIQHKEMRFALAFLPYLYILAGFGLFTAWQSARTIRVGDVHARVKTFEKTIVIISVIAGMAWMAQSYVGIGQAWNYAPRYIPSAFNEHLSSLDNQAQVWVSSPLFMANSDLKSSGLMYYPLFDSQKILQLSNQLRSASDILIDTCDFECPPWDAGCESAKSALFAQIRQEFNTNYEENGLICSYYIFSARHVS
ncbi:MAG: hypothetical protein QS98_C0014G0017 [archaeon GW2011_AR3]|nr:MAG: hypothetical protein QS98_C0014G0017 [archaeon GW2011_AR3]MBS3109262.1 glycosyltransferase family 39 protein [Candidatus Woesearchaeota archaeon]